MFFVLSKTVAFLLLPSNLLFLGVLAGFLLALTRLRRAGMRLLAVSILLLALVGYLPLGYYLTQILENRFPAWDASRGAPDGIIILGGAIDPDLTSDRGEVAVGGSVRRLIAMANLARKFPNARIVYSGGNANLLTPGVAEAGVLGPLLDTFGIARARVALESRSRNTAENAAFSKEMIKPGPGERWLLVTSAEHMPRAVGCFRAIGFDVEPYPVDWRTQKAAGFGFSAYLTDGLSQADHAVHEWLGLVAYWLTGRTSELLPGPQPAQ
jgi:uncharacterized SAM-binding protein YcdF (DUF218 family)